MTTLFPLADLEAYVVTETASAMAAARLRESANGSAELVDARHREAVRLQLVHRLAAMKVGIFDEPPHPSLMRDLYSQIEAAGLWPYQVHKRQKRQTRK